MSQQNILIEKALITTSNGSDQFDIATVITDLLIYEHIDRPYLTGSLQFLDTVGVFDRAQFQGLEKFELILKEKGKLPVIPFLERVKIVESIKYVDMVVPQTNKNKQEAIDKYNIDAISVGDDWKGRYPKTSCPVEYFTYTPNVSSTILKGLLSNSKT